MFHHLKILYFICEFFTKFTYNEYIGPYFLSTFFYDFRPVIFPRLLHHTKVPSALVHRRITDILQQIIDHACAYACAPHLDPIKMNVSPKKLTGNLEWGEGLSQIHWPIWRAFKRFYLLPIAQSSILIEMRVT